jgi:hypothetical protein
LLDFHSSLNFLQALLTPSLIPKEYPIAQEVYIETGIIERNIEPEK